LKLANPLTRNALSNEMTSSPSGMGVPASTRTGEVGVALGSGVGVSVGVGDGDGVTVGLLVGVGVSVGVLVGEGVGAAVGAGRQAESSSTSRINMRQFAGLWVMLGMA